jgi:hypothetical protein
VTAAGATAGRAGWPAIAAACVAVAAVSLVLPSEPTYDPWAWLVWGRELSSFELDTIGGPSWKPLPSLAIALFAPLGALDPSLPPALWIIVVRACGLGAIVLAGRLALRLSGGRRSAALLAGLLLAVSPGWLRYLAHGNEVPVALMLVLLALDRQLAGAPRAAFAAGVAAVLVRPELAPLLAVQGIWLWRAEPRARPLVAAAPALLALLWLVPERLGSGDPLAAWRQASGEPSWSLSHESVPWLAALGRAHDLAGPVVEAGLVAALATGTARRLALASLGGVALVAAMTEAGFSGNERYFAVPLGLACVAAGAGLAEALARAERAVRGRSRRALAAARGRPRARPLATAALACVLAAAVALQAGRLETDAREIRATADLHAGLELTAARVPEAGERPPAVNRAFHTHLAWIAGASIADVERGGPAPAVIAAFSDDAGVLGRRVLRSLPRARPAGRVGPWRIFVRAFSPARARPAARPASRSRACGRRCRGASRPS